MSDPKDKNQDSNNKKVERRDGNQKNSGDNAGAEDGLKKITKAIKDD